jgi:NAD(P)-dependent dehydrogenase (short-subunit alcohol dehydrogenase family)
MAGCGDGPGGQHVTAIVLGGSGTVGREVCRMLAERGVPLGYTYHTNANAGIDAPAKPLDVTDVAAIENTIDAFAGELGPIHSLVNCAAVGTAHLSLEEIDEDAWDAMIAINTKPSFFAVRRAAHHMRQNGGGSIVLLGSIDGVKTMPSPVHYAASKGALAAMVRAAAKELGPDNIRINSVAPGILERGLSATIPDDLRNEHLKHCGLKRLGRVEEIASLVTWLATENTFVSGQTLVVDGGL